MNLFSRLRKSDGDVRFKHNNKSILIGSKHGLFDDIIGFEDIKSLFELAIKAESPGSKDQIPLLLLLLLLRIVVWIQASPLFLYLLILFSFLSLLRARRREIQHGVKIPEPLHGSSPTAVL
jgi:hypothetical protein